MWEAMTECIRRSAKEILGISRRVGNKMEGVWWWNEEVKEKVKEKKEAYACLLYTSPSPRDGLLSRMPSSA